MEQLLTRDKFREGVFARDGHMCVFCGAPAVDAHHILERRLWPDGGYYMSNGASVCEEHHLACERTDIELYDVRKACGITKFVIPPHLYDDQEYDKWGNVILPNGNRLKGDLFHDESVQKILDSHLDKFVDYVKYPRTYHVPWSEGMNDDDRQVPSMEHFFGQDVVVTEKMDGENTTMYRDYIHARSVDGRSHPSRDRVKSIWGQIQGDIPEGWRICGENLYARHSIHYNHLPSYFMGFSIWNDRNVCLSWDETSEWFNLLEIPVVPVLYRGQYDEQKIKDLWKDMDRNSNEGYVIRSAGEFTYGNFRKNVAKFVRANHVQTTAHWMHGQPIIPNQLQKETKVED